MRTKQRNFNRNSTIQLGAIEADPTILKFHVGARSISTLNFITDINRANPRELVRRAKSPNMMKAIGDLGMQLVDTCLEANTSLALATTNTFLDNIDQLTDAVAKQTPTSSPIKLSLRPTVDATRARETNIQTQQMRRDIYGQFRIKHDPFVHDYTTIDTGVYEVGLDLARKIRNSDEFLDISAIDSAITAPDNGVAGHYYGYHLASALDARMNEINKDEAVRMLQAAQSASSLGVHGSVKLDQVSRRFSTMHGSLS